MNGPLAYRGRSPLPPFQLGVDARREEREIMQPARRVRGLPLLSNKTTTTTQALSPPQVQHSSVLRIRAPRRDDPSLLDAVDQTEVTAR